MSDAEITQLDLTEIREQHILQFDVAMDDVLLMEVAQGLYQLFDEDLRLRLFQSPAFAQVSQHIAPDAQLHEEKFIASFSIVNAFVELYDVGMAACLEDLFFSRNSIDCLLLVHYANVDRLDCTELHRQCLHAQVDFAICTLAEHSAISVPFLESVRQFLILFQALFDFALDLIHCFILWLHLLSVLRIFSQFRQYLLNILNIVNFEKLRLDKTHNRLIMVFFRFEGTNEILRHLT